MSKLQLFHRILKRVRAYHIVGLFVAFVFLVFLVFLLVEPEINNYGDALWYSYVNLFTIGFGDIVPQTFIGRILPVVLTIYATLVIALITGSIAALYLALIKDDFIASKEEVIDKLTHLDKLPKAELKEISERIKRINK